MMRNNAKKALSFTEDIGLLVIAIATVIAFGAEIKLMVVAQKVTLADLLLMFIYLEVLAMVGVYLDSGKLPIRIPLYIAIVALARYLILDMKEMSVWQMLATAAGAHRCRPEVSIVALYTRPNIKAHCSFLTITGTGFVTLPLMAVEMLLLIILRRTFPLLAGLCKCYLAPTQISIM